MFLELNMLGEENLPELGRATGDRERSGTREVDRAFCWLGRVDACFGCVLRKKGVRKGGIDNLAKVGC
jgi:hypothetical protein